MIQYANMLVDEHESTCGVPIRPVRSPKVDLTVRFHVISVLELAWKCTSNDAFQSQLIIFRSLH